MSNGVVVVPIETPSESGKRRGNRCSARSSIPREPTSQDQQSHTSGRGFGEGALHGLHSFSGGRRRVDGHQHGSGRVGRGVDHPVSGRHCGASACARPCHGVDRRPPAGGRVRRATPPVQRPPGLPRDHQEDLVGDLDLGCDHMSSLRCRRWQTVPLARVGPVRVPGRRAGRYSAGGPCDGLSEPQGHSSPIRLARRAVHDRGNPTRAGQCHHDRAVHDDLSPPSLDGTGRRRSPAYSTKGCCGAPLRHRGRTGDPPRSTPKCSAPVRSIAARRDRCQPSTSAKARRGRARTRGACPRRRITCGNCPAVRACRTRVRR